MMIWDLDIDDEPTPLRIRRRRLPSVRALAIAVAIAIVVLGLAFVRDAVRGGTDYCSNLWKYRSVGASTSGAPRSEFLQRCRSAMPE